MMKAGAIYRSTSNTAKRQSMQDFVNRADFPPLFAGNFKNHPRAAAVAVEKNAPRPDNFRLSHNRSKPSTPGSSPNRPH